MNDINSMAFLLEFAFGLIVFIMFIVLCVNIGKIRKATEHTARNSDNIVKNVFFLTQKKPE